MKEGLYDGMHNDGRNGTFYHAHLHLHDPESPRQKIVYLVWYETMKGIMQPGIFL